MVGTQLIMTQYAIFWQFINKFKCLKPKLNQIVLNWCNINKNSIDISNTKNKNKKIHFEMSSKKKHFCNICSSY